MMHIGSIREYPPLMATLKTTKMVSWFGLIFYCFFVTYCALIPFYNWQMPKGDIVEVLMYGWLNKIFMFDVIQNLLMYLPMGVFAVFVMGIERWGWGLALAFGLSLFMSGSLEFIQSFNPARVPSALDIILNTLSGFIGGALTAFFYERWIQGFHQFGKLMHPFSIKNPMPVVSMGLIIGWCAYQWYPYIPTLHPVHLQQGYAPLLSVMLNTDLFTMSKFISYASQTLLLYALALVSLKDKQIVFIFCCLLLVLPLKIIIIGRVLSFEAVAGSLLGLAIAYTMDILSKRIQSLEPSSKG